MTNSIFSAKNIDEADAVIVSAPYEKTASSRKGTVDGPKAVIDMLDSQLELFDRTYKMQPSDKIKIEQIDLGDISAFSPEQALEKITTECEKLINKDKYGFSNEYGITLVSLNNIFKRDCIRKRSDHK